MTPEQIAELKYKHKELLILEQGRSELIKSINDLKTSFVSGRDKILTIDAYTPNRTLINLGRADRQNSIVKMLLAQLEEELAFFDKRLADL